MAGSDESKRPFLSMLPLRFKIALVSFLSLVVTAACSRLRLRDVEEPDVLCYTVISPTDTPTPVVMCYEVALPTDTPTPVCYTATPSLSASHTPTATLTPTPLCYTPTPSPTAQSADAPLLLTPAKVLLVLDYVPQADVEPVTPLEARRRLLEELLAEGRFPRRVAKRLSE